MRLKLLLISSGISLKKKKITEGKMIFAFKKHRCSTSDFAVMLIAITFLLLLITLKSLTNEINLELAGRCV